MMPRTEYRCYIRATGTEVALVLLVDAWRQIIDHFANQFSVQVVDMQMHGTHENHIRYYPLPREVYTKAHDRIFVYTFRGSVNLNRSKGEANKDFNLPKRWRAKFSGSLYGLQLYQVLF